MSQLSSAVFIEARKFLSPEQKALTYDVELILSRLKTFDRINDYSFLVSPIAKTYEGYLKKFFLDLHIINQYDYESDRFRVGKTLNPSLRYKRFSIFQKLSDLDDKGEQLAESLWDAWKFGRNEIFHYFPGKSKNLDRQEAEDRIYLVLNAIIKSGEFLLAHADQNDLL